MLVAAVAAVVAVQRARGTGLHLAVVAVQRARAGLLVAAVAVHRARGTGLLVAVESKRDMGCLWPWLPWRARGTGLLVAVVVVESKRDRAACGRGCRT